MVLKAEIIEINIETNTYTVHIPQFDLNNGFDPVQTTAQVCVPPGIYNGYHVGDKVWVSFEQHQIGQPVIIGRLGVATLENQNTGGAIKGSNLEITEKASLPKLTTLSGAEPDYNDINKLIIKIKQLEERTQVYGDLPTTLESIQDTLTTFDMRGINNTTTGGIDPTVVNQIAFNNITAIQEVSTLNTNFPIGKILFVKDNLGKQYSLWSKIDVYPVYATCSTDNTLVEFSNGQQTNHFDKLPGCWKIKAFLTGGFLAQKCQETDSVISSEVVLIGNGSFSVPCALYDSTGEALSWYWESEDSADAWELRSIRTKDLTFFTTAADNSTLVAINESTTKNQIFKIAVEQANYEDESEHFKIIQDYQGDRTKRVDCLAILNLNYPGGADKLLNGTANTANPPGPYPSLFESNSTQNNIFASGDTGFGVECVYLPEDYYQCYTVGGPANSKKGLYTKINIAQFMVAKNLTEIYIPSSTAYIDKKAFSGTGEKRCSKTPLRLLNLENSVVHFFGEESLKNVRLDESRLKLPKNPVTGLITFDSKAISYVNWSSNVPTIKMIIAQSPLDFDHDLAGNSHSGAFYVTNAFVNKFVKELVYPTSSAVASQELYVLDLLRQSSIKSFLKTDVNITVTTEHITEILNAFEQNAISTKPNPDMVITTQDAQVSVRFVNRQKAPGNYVVGNATIPTIVYNY